MMIVELRHCVVISLDDIPIVQLNVNPVEMLILLFDVSDEVDLGDRLISFKFPIMKPEGSWSLKSWDS